ncbi:glycosyltransferase [Calothrix sp. UHCC 0171]|uniref:glycosyltransferase n=1 Tax=Calothrix sp. UHCC 0171 TaxID=3110245 RepID=UPI002B1EB06B|nr:glycosyltransferase [Calothrix sp. UHCC 0171]MEA5574136.1 glycosyltransferase [Calothrix sp. UHCC 0171]
MLTIKIAKRITNKAIEYLQQLLIPIEKRWVISLEPESPAIGNVLLSYILKPFDLKKGESIPVSHTHFWECMQMAQTFLDMGYSVDCIHFQNKAFIPQKDYDFFIDVRLNLQRSFPYLNPDCIKIFHADTAHLLFHNAAEAKRLVELQQRRGITLNPRRYEAPNQALESADYAMVLGNDFTLGTYAYANKPMYKIPISTPTTYPWFDRDFDKCRKNFLFFSSGGMVHKGLDLLLDVFSQMPDYHLTICGPVDREEDFVKAFHKELYETPNIHTVGWVDVTGQQFQEIMKNSVGLVYPSCSEGQSGAVISCLHGGLIPILSYESGVDVNDFGVILQNCSLEKIKAAIVDISSRSSRELSAMSRGAWEYARANHTKERFAEVYRNTILDIQKHHREKSAIASISTSRNYLLVAR